MANDLQTVSRGKSHGRISLIFCMLVFIAPFVIPRIFYDFSVVTKEAVIQIGVMAVLSGWLFFGGRVKIPKAFVYVALFLAYCWASLLWAVNPYEGFSTMLHWSICSLAILIVANVVKNDHLFFAMFASGVAVAAIGLMQCFVGIKWFQQVAGFSSTFANKNFAAHYSVICMVAGLAVFGRSKTLAAAGCGVILGYLWVCRTDAAVVAILGVCICKCPKDMKFLISLIVVAAIWVLVWTPGGLKIRIEIWKNPAIMAAHNPSGVGVGNFKIHQPEYNTTTFAPNLVSGQHVEQCHNEFLELFSEVGFVGMLLFIFAALGVFGACGINPAIVAICAIAMFSFPMRLPNIPFIGACILGAVSK